MGGEEIAAGRWKSKKALMIFKYLIFRRMQWYTQRDVLVELIWPDEDPEKTRKRFHFALAALRKALEPELPRGVPSSYILSSGDAYLLNIDKYAEHIYQKLIKYYASMGNNAMAARIFEKCRQYIAEGLNIPISNETEKIYREILAIGSR